MRGQPYCFSHNPATKRAKKKAVAKGGRNRRTPSRASPPQDEASITSIQDVRDLLFRTLAEVRNGKLDAVLARTIGYIAGVAAKVTETAELDQRVQKLEDRFVTIHQQVEEQREFAK